VRVHRETGQIIRGIFGVKRIKHEKRIKIIYVIRAQYTAETDTGTVNSRLSRDYLRDVS
jgi:hypothetical protein